MAKTSIAVEEGQEGSLREGLEAAIRERVREVMEMVLEEEVEAALGAGRSERVVERVGYRHGHKSRRLTLRSGAVQMQVPRSLSEPTHRDPPYVCRPWRVCALLFRSSIVL